jgi:adenosine deaminase
MLQLKFFLSDTESLASYNHGNFVSFNDIERRLFLKAREQDRAVPDSYYLLAKDETFKQLDSIGDILTKGLKKLSEDYLELDGVRVHVKTTMQTQWQELITFIPPLLLQAIFLQNKIAIDAKDNAALASVVKNYLLPNTKYTAIPNARIPQLDHYLTQQQGLHDLHMHLNGALETDQVWQDYLFTPESIYHDLKEAFGNPKTKEQLEQESHLLEPKTYVSLLKSAQALRRFFFDYLFSTGESLAPNKYVLLQKILNHHSDYQGSYKHPFLSLIGSDNSSSYPMSIEALMYLLMLDEIRKHKNETLAGFFHFYLLILGLTNRLLVQQTHQNGFDQFQKHTLNGLREQSERIYRRRYYQMHGNGSRHLHFLEGRFSPKKTKQESIIFINDIWNGWEEMCKRLEELKKEGDEKIFDKPQLRLIAHFIKKADNRPDDFVRHKHLRYDLWQRGKVLALLLSNHEKYRKRVVAVDAAANEFDASPEVFAPVFRLMRRYGVKHFTYHAGEDFYHIPGGLRAIYEAITFCNLQKGDRIGHATATGLPAVQWAQVVGNHILIRQGEYLDDLIFIYHLIIEAKIESLHGIIPFLVNKIQDLSFHIYNDHYPVTVLERAWLMRQCCPVHLLEEDRECANLKLIFSDEEWQFPLDAKFIDSRKNIKSAKAWKVFEKYHSKACKNHHHKIISVHPFEIIKIEQIELLQLALLKEMNRREIVIETLPSSNVRIGFHKDFSTYHLYNWIKWREEGKSIPPIVVGSDDTGIFATNIYNEYANIYCAMLNHHHMSHAQVMEVIKKLDEDSRIYRFE